jgi:hypothetical protein
MLGSGSLWDYPNYIEQATRPDPDSAHGSLRYDPELGHAARPGSSAIVEGRTIHYTAEGLRSNGRPPPEDAGAILVVGDSYTEGYGVDDVDTWPSLAERNLGRRVLNAGVRGYGIDQMVLRAAHLADRSDLRAIVLAFIEADVDRVGLSLMGSLPRPYFAATGDGLELRNVPTPPRPLPGLWRNVLGYSFLLDAVMRRAGAADWWYGDKQRTGESADLVACRLMARFAVIVKAHNLAGVVVAIPQFDLWYKPEGKESGRPRVKAVLECASREGLAVVDTYDAFDTAGASTDIKAFYPVGHLSAQGNALVARQVGEALRPILLD